MSSSKKMVEITSMAIRAIIGKSFVDVGGRNQGNDY